MTFSSAMRLLLMLPVLMFASCRWGGPPRTQPAPSATVSIDAEGFISVPIECDNALPPSEITEIRIHRDGGCLGYYRSLGSNTTGPEFMTGSCAEYTLTLREDGPSEYVGRRHVPVVGRAVGELDVQAFRRLARLADEIRFEQWSARYPVPSPSESAWMCVTMDGEGPVTVSIVRAGRRTAIENDPNRLAPAWLPLFQQEIDRVGESIAWRFATGHGSP